MRCVFPVLGRMAGGVLAVILLVACKPASPPTTPAPEAAAQSQGSSPMIETQTKETRPMDASAAPSSDTPPAPDAVLYFIYNKDGDGATSYEIENGSVATYWFGHQFELEGKRYFTGFAYDTPEKYTAAQKAAKPDPLAKVNLTEATFILSKPGTDKPWSFRGADRSIGEFGASEKGNAVDSSREVVEFKTQDGLLLLAVPGIAQSPAPETKVYSVMVFDPRQPSEDTGESPWSYLGDVLAGNGPNAFEMREGNALPAFVTGGGQATGVAGESIMIPDAYVYDEANKAYLELQ